MCKSPLVLTEVHGQWPPKKTTNRERASLDQHHDFGVGRIVVHSVLSGTSVPLGEDSCKVRIVLLDAVQQDSSGDFLEGRSEIKSNKRTREASANARYWMGFDHLACSVWSSNTIL